MKDKVETNCYKLAWHFLVTDSLFKIVVIPYFMISFTAAHFGIHVLEVIAQIETAFIFNIIEKKVCVRLMLLYMFVPFTHYFLIFLADAIISFLINSIIRESFREFTKEYVMVNFDHYHTLGSGQIQSIIVRRMTSMSELLRLFFLSIVRDSIYVVMAYRTILLKIDRSAFFVNLMFPVFFISSTYWLLKKRTNVRLEYNEMYNQTANQIYSTLVNYDVVKSYNNEDKEIEKLDKHLEKVQKRGLSFLILTAFIEFIQKIATVMPNGIVLYCALTGVYFYKMQNFTGFVLYNRLFLQIKERFEKIRENILRSTQYLTDIGDSKINNQELDNDGSGIDISGLKQGIVFNNVKLEVADRVLFDKANFTIKKGEKIAIVGKNGTGKSTLINLLLRFKNYSGEVLIDGVEMKNITKKSQREIISYIPQNPSVQQGTLLENITYHNNKVSKEKVINLCKEYGVHDVFCNLKDGYMTDVGEQGKFLSGGQKQRVSLMRAVLKNGDIFLFDEPTSNLDITAEKEVIDFIFTYLKYKTSIIILHNHSLLTKFDKIIGIRDKKIYVYQDHKEFERDSYLY